MPGVRDGGTGNRELGTAMLIRKITEFILGLLFYLIFGLFCTIVVLGIFICAIINWLMDLWKKK